MKRCIFSLLAVLIMVGAGPVQSAVILDGGYITAVEGFVYDGKVYDVEFKNGNFNTVFGSTTPEFWNDATTDHKAVGLALSQAFNDAGHGGTIIKDGSSASSMFYLPIREEGSNTLYDTEAFYNDTTPWKWKLTGSDYDKDSVLGMFAVFMPVAPQVANLTIIKEADPEDGTDFDFTINGPTTWTDYAPSGTWGLVRILTESNGKSYFSFRDSSYNHYLYELDGTTWTDITPSGMWEDILFVTETGGKSYFSFRDSSWDFHLHEFDGT
ncbi:MAG: hypothetical protein GY808_20365, partial [Gammaproteobacteria bacterium]|nr:hypothetical protein [Gammaproteobacteria bacterium]